MNYICKIDFVDMQDGNRVYRAGEKYPRTGHTPTNERIKALTSAKNAMGIAVIALQQIEAESTNKAPETAKSEPAKKPAGTASRRKKKA